MTFNFISRAIKSIFFLKEILEKVAINPYFINPYMLFILIFFPSYQWEGQNSKKKIGKY